VSAESLLVLPMHAADPQPATYSNRSTRVRLADRVQVSNAGAEVLGSQGRFYLFGEGIVVPMPCDLSHDASAGWVLTNEDTGIYGVGEGVVDAIMDLRLALREHLGFLLEDEHALSIRLAAQLRYLRAHVAPVIA